MVILLSPAFEVSLYNNLVALATSRQIQYKEDQRPVLAMFTSKTDAATHYAFPFGRFFSTLFQNTRKETKEADLWQFSVKKNTAPNQNQAIKNTPGFDTNYVTYDLVYTTNYSKPPSPQSRNSHIQDVQQLQQEWFDNLRRAKYASWLTNSTPPGCVTNAPAAASAIANTSTNLLPITFLNDTNRCAYVLTPRIGSKFGNTWSPFLNVAVDKQIMNGHNDIANSNLVSFLQDFISITINQTNYTRGHGR